jgi:hypothetical protein
MTYFPLLIFIKFNDAVISTVYTTEWGYECCGAETQVFKILQRQKQDVPVFRKFNKKFWEELIVYFP